MPNVIPILNMKPTNPTQEEFLKIQKFGLQPYDRNPNDYLRFVAKIFTAWRDPNDNILNFDPFDNNYGVDTGTSLTLQATADKSIIAYVDGFQADYNFVRLTTDEASTVLTTADNVIDPGSLKTIIDDKGNTITIDKSKYGEYHRFLIKPGICFIDNQLIQIVKETEWWFRVPIIRDYNTDNEPQYEMGQFIADPLKIYSLLPNKNYKIILSYEYINQFDSNSARLRFETDDTAIDEPYFLIGTFTTDQFGMVHQTEPINEKSFEKFRHYVVKERPNVSTGKLENYYYLKDINPQYLDKKYMSNHKNLFKHLQNQLLTVLSESDISNKFICREITEDIDPSVSSGDMVYYDGLTKRWYPAEVSRQDFDRVVGLYLKNSSEGTDFVYTSGIIQVDNRYTILDSENLVLRNLIPGAEYFLAEDTNTALNTMPFIDTIKITDQREVGYFSIMTEVVAKASSIEIEMIPTPGSGLAPFSRKRTFELDPNIGEQRISQSISWIFTAAEIAGLPVIKMSGVGPIQTEKLTFNIKLNMVESSIVEKNKDIVEDFKLYDNGDIIIDYVNDKGLPTESILPIKIEESHLYISTNGIPDTILARGPGGSPVMKLLEVLGTKSPKDYIDIGIAKDDLFGSVVPGVYNLDDIENELKTIVDDLNFVIYNNSPSNFGLTEILALLGDEVTKINTTVANLHEAKIVLEENYKAARLEFQSTESSYQIAINNTRNEYQIVKDTYDSLVSKQGILTQKKNAVIVKLGELNTLRSQLVDAKIAFGGSNANLSDLINNVQIEINTLNTEITTLINDIGTLATQITTITSTLSDNFNTALAMQMKSFNYELSYYAIPTSTSIVDYSDKTLILQRAFSNLKNIYDLTLRSETEKAKMILSEKNYLDKLSIYTDGVVGGIYTYADQLLASNEVINKKQIFDQDKANYQSTIDKLVDARKIRDDYIKPKFDIAKDAVRAELFIKVTPNTDPNSTWGNANITEFKIRLSKASPINLYFDFVFKEDTNDVMRITIPAGDTVATNTVHLQNPPDSRLDAGVPKWIVTDDAGKVVDSVLNLNKLNQALISNHVMLTADATKASEPELFTLNSTEWLANPITSSKPTQLGSKLRGVSALDDLYTLALTIHNNFDLRENYIASKVLKENEKLSKENVLLYKTNYKTGLDQQFALGTTIVNSYDAEIAYVDNSITFYTSSDETIDIGLVGSNYSLDVCNTKLALIDVQIISYGNDLSVKLVAYNDALKLLKDATDAALGEYVDGIRETQNLIDLRTKDKDRIKVMFDLYTERTNIVINIYKNLNSILSNGMFNNEWIATDTFLLNRFEYENALEKQLIEILDDTCLIPVSSIIIPKVLEYTIGTNGLQYPMDLQPWIFVKTSGKISTKNYPGATSVGIALNENTLILNIKHNKCGDISEFLNVYGNETDFINQLTAKYKSGKVSGTKIETLTALLKLQNQIIELTTLTSKNATVKTVTVNGKSFTLTTSLSVNEMDVLNVLIGGLTSSTLDGTVSDSEDTFKKKEFLLRLIYSKFYGSKQWYNPQEYLFGNTKSSSSWFTIPGNTFLLSGKDPFNPEATNGTILDFKSYVTKLFNDVSAGTLLLATMQELFQKKLPLYKDLDILNYILAILPEPLVDYNAKFLKLKGHYTSILKSRLDISRYIKSDNPYKTSDDGSGNLTSIDDFENPALDDAFIENAARKASVKALFDNLIAVETVNKTNEEAKVDADRIGHSNIANRIAKYDYYKTYYNSLKEDILVAIRYYEEKLTLAKSLKNYFDSKIAQMDKEYLTYYNKVNQLPNVMWDIFRITNSQRIKWNYTYLALRIKGMQKELNNTVSNNTIQYSPINAEISELKIKKNASLANKEVAEAYAYDLQIKALEQKKTNFTSLLQNMVLEFNTIQNENNASPISATTFLEDSFLIDALYMQDPDEYNLSYAFAPYPAYKELA